MKKTAVSMMIILALCFAGAECHAEYKLPDTGQTKCYDDGFNNSSGIPLPSPGQDFYGQDCNYTINPPSYTKLDANGNALPDSATSWAMIKGNNTGLIWENKNNSDGVKNYSNPHDADNTYLWSGYTWYDYGSGIASTDTDSTMGCNSLFAKKVSVQAEPLPKIL